MRMLCWNMLSVRSHTSVQRSAVVAASVALASTALTRDSRFATWLRRSSMSPVPAVSHPLSANSAPATIRAAPQDFVLMRSYPL